MKRNNPVASDDSRLPAGLSELEVAAGFPLGEDRGVPPLPPVDSSLSPLRALEQAVLPALQRTPCLVSFSGGRDSSAVLAVAVGVAKRESLVPPVAVTLRFPGAGAASESAWQEEVMAYVAVPEWERIEVTDELDWVGPVARDVLLRHGLRWPPNLHAHVPMLQRASGGSVLTGFDGDGILGSWRWTRVNNVLARRVRPQPRDLPRLGMAAAPRQLRRRVLSRRDAPELPWLRTEARDAYLRGWIDDRSSEPARWDARVAWQARRRYLGHLQSGLELLARDTGASVVNPLLDPRFLAALARAGGRCGFGDRRAVMHTLFSGLLPDRVLDRRTKAVFDQVFWGPATRRFAVRWRGDGVNPALVDRATLRRTWSQPSPSFFAATSLQSAWIADSTATAQ